MSDNGLVPPEQLIADGVLQRCGTTRKPQSKDGAYIIHPDSPYSLWWENHATGESDTYSEQTAQTLTPAERKAQAERIARDKQKRVEQTAIRYATAAQKAQAEFATLPDATDSNPYLLRKGVPALGNVRAKGDVLVIPLTNAAGNISSLQYIQADGAKLFLEGGLKRGCFFNIPAKDNNEQAPLLIAEGYATAASLHLATKYQSVVAFDAGNLTPVAQALRTQYPRREIIICADNDVPSKLNPVNTGVKAAKKAAEDIDATLAICPTLNGGKADFNDLHQARGLDAVRSCIEDARATATEQTTASPIQTEKAAPPSKTELRYGFETRTSGLWYVQYKEDGTTNDTWLCSPLHVLGRTRDADSNSWGLLLEWHDQDGKTHTWAMPISLLYGNDISPVIARLTDEGLKANIMPSAKRQICQYLATHDTQVPVLCVNTTGWHDGRFILNKNTIEAPDHQGKSERVVFQSATARNPYTVKGTLEAYQNSIGAWARGNSRIMFAICASLSATLLYDTRMENGGFNFVGGSSTGKTTALYIGASVWGNPQEYMYTWRATDNALEGLSCLHNDAALCLDELGQAPAKIVGEAIYMLGNGKGKGRAKQDGTAKTVKSWRTVILSTGEKSIAEKIAAEGGKVNAGQEVRFVDIPADAGAGLGIFEDLHGFERANAFALALKQAATTQYGHLAQEFIRRLIRKECIAEEIQNILEYGTLSLCSDPQADGQVQRVARRFMLAATAGEYAAECGLLPWSRGEAIQAAKQCFNAWIEQRGGTGAQEDNALLGQVMLFIEKHGQSRFQDLSALDTVCANRAGFRQKTDEGTLYYILPQCFKDEVCHDADAIKAAKLLADTGLLKREGRNFTWKLPKFTDLGRPRCYVLLFR